MNWDPFFDRVSGSGSTGKTSLVYIPYNRVCVLVVVVIDILVPSRDAIHASAI